MAPQAEEEAPLRALPAAFDRRQRQRTLRSEEDIGKAPRELPTKDARAMDVLRTAPLRAQAILLQMRRDRPAPRQRSTGWERGWRWACGWGLLAALVATAARSLSTQPLEGQTRPPLAAFGTTNGHSRRSVHALECAVASHLWCTGSSGLGQLAAAAGSWS